MNRSAALSIVRPPDDPLAEHTDAELLRLWAKARDEPALRALIDRYGPLVLGVCRRQCRHCQDAEDAFQGTFLLLARDAARIRHPERLASWLHAVAFRTASRTRGRSERYTLSLVEDPPDATDPLGQVARRHQLRLLDEELAGLPERYRQPLVLHYLEGRTCPEIADRLQTTIGAVRGRLDRAKRQLRRRLLGRGVALPGVLAALAAWRPSPSAAAELAERAGSEITSGAAADPASPVPDLSLLSAEATMMTTSGFVSLVATAAAALSLAAFSPPALSPDAGAASPLTLTAVGGPTTAATRLIAQQQKGSEPGGADGSADAAPSEAAGAGRPSSDAMPFVEGYGGGSAGSLGMRYHAPRSKPAPAAPARPPAEEHIRQTLSQSANLSISGATVEEALAQIAEQYALPIVTEVGGFGARAIDLQEPVRFSAGEMPLASALRLMLRRHQLTYTIEDDLLKVVPDAEALAESGLGTANWPSLDSARAQRLEQVLSQPVTVEFLDEPLENVAEYLSIRLGVTILLDTHALDELGLTRDIPITLELREGEVPVASALELILDEYDLTYTLRGNVISITTEEAAEADQLVRLYWLAGTGLTGQSAGELIQTVIDPDTWEATGGPSTIAVVEPRSGRRTGLAILTTYTTHRRIQRLLDSLRGTEEEPSAGAAGRSTPGRSKPKEQATEGTKRKAGGDPFGNGHSADDPFGN